ncbi:MAG: hypothetical protein P8P77_05475, partial [Crocinitomicaceae bacterium]|nr:hypothetical protein [Crocinitomicaceae bacterium]
KMKKTLFSLAIVSIALASCKKEKNGVDDFSREISLEAAQITLPSSGGEMNVSQALLKSSSADYYTSGELEYVQNGVSVAKVNFGQGEENSLAELTKDGNVSSFDLKKDESYFDGKKSKYKKVIVEPLVKSEDCGYIIAGVIKYYDYKTGAWVATIDFGDRVCDEWATKTAADWSGEYVFSLDDWKK